MRRFWFGGARRGDPVGDAAERLYAAAVAAARDPALYRDLHAPDTIEGRFELLTAHVILLVERLRAAGSAAAELRQRLFDTYVGHLDGALREMGVGDLAMARRMKSLGGTFYGRARAYDQALASLPQTDDFAAVVSRSILAGVQVDPTPLCEALLARRRALDALADEALLAGEAVWT